MFNKKTISVIAGSILVLAIIGGFLALKSADFVDGKIRKSLTEYNINQQLLPEPEKRFGAIRYKNISLSEEGETAIDTLTLTFSPFNWATIESINIDGLFLSGEIDINGKLSIKGIDKLSLNPSDKIKTISIKNANFSLLSAHLGGIRGTMNISAAREDNVLVWSGNIDSRQDQFELISKFNGQMNENSSWINDFEIENAKLERSTAKFTRTFGSASWQGDDTGWKKLTAELNAGGFTAKQSAWKNAGITIEANPKGIKYTIGAKSVGLEELELNIEALYTKKSLAWNANIHSPTGGQLLTYLLRNKYMPFDKENFEQIFQTKNTNLIIKSRSNNLIFSINNEEQNTLIKGKIEKINEHTSKITTTASSDYISTEKGVTCVDNEETKNLCTFEIIQKDGAYTLKN